MSIQVIDTAIYNVVGSRMLGMTMNKTVDINYCSVIKNAFSTEQSVEEFLMRLLTLNLKSYCVMYGGSKFDNTGVKVNTKTKPINTYQLLRYLEAIEYQIEVGTIEKSDNDYVSLEEAVAYDLLQKIIKSLRVTIINELPQYKETKWATI